MPATPHLLIIPAAFVLDLLVGDPLRLPHPIRWMGAAIERCEPFFRRRFQRLAHAGFWFAVFLISATWLSGFVVVYLARQWHPWCGWILEVILIFYCLSVRSLLQAGGDVRDALVKSGLPAGRRMVSRIVGREVHQLTATGVSRAAVESVAENMVDGVLAPLFFAAIGGAPLALTYKMINTLDSMVGYRNARYQHFGRAAARIDDGANWIPARLAVPLTALGSVFLGFDGLCAWQTGRREGRFHASPNAGFAEAAFAGALRVRLGGPNVYHGRRVDKPWIGAAFAEATPADISRAGVLMLTTSMLALLLAWATAWLAACAL